MINNSRFEKAYDFCNLLKEDIFKEEINDLLNGYTLKDMKLENGEYKCILFNENKDKICLFLCPNELLLYEYKTNSSKQIKIEENNVLTEVEIEKRKKGVLYIEKVKHFSTSMHSVDKLSLVDLYETRYAFTNETLEIITEKEDAEKINLFDILLSIKTNALETKDISDLYNEFETHMKHNFRWSGYRYITNDIYPTRTYINGEDVSSIYDVNEGTDKLYRVYDLYRGIINPRNDIDINKIKMGYLSQKAFDLKTLMGITGRENLLLGLPVKTNDNTEYVNYLKEFLNVSGEIETDRDSIISYIMRCKQLKLTKRK